MYYHYKNIPISLNNNSFVIDDLQLSNEIKLDSRYYVGDSVSENQSPSQMWVGSLRLSYYLTGLDYLKQYIYSNKDESISGNIAGLLFQQGYLSDYSINVEPNIPIKVTSTISFFDKLTGTLSPITVVNNTGFILRSSDIQINNMAGYTENLLNNFSRASFSYTCNLQPSYNYFDTGISPTKADNIFLQERTITTEIISDNTNLTLPLSGEKFGAIFTFSNPFNTGLYETFGCSGLISSKSLNINTNSPHNHVVKITQNHVNKQGYIYSVITGINQIIINSNSGSFPFLSRDGSLSYIDNIYIGDTQLTGYSVNRTSSYDQIVSPIPFNILNDILTINTSYGNYVWPNKINFSYPQITVTGISSITGQPGNILTISGTNFVRISDVFFGGSTESIFQTINPQTIVATIPNNGQTSPIIVSSYYRNTSGNSPTFFYPPIITSMNPTTGQWKDIISLTGSNFSGITGAFFNQIKAYSLSIINNSLLNVQTPDTGNGFPSGYINIYGTGGNTQSISVYNPTIPIYSFYPPSGLPNTPLAIYTKIDTGYYYPFSGGYKVRVDGVDMVFYVSGNNATGILTGLSPISEISSNDYLYIYKPDGITSSASTTIFSSLGSPIITNIYPNIINQYQFIPLILYGQNLSYFYTSSSYIAISGGNSGDMQTYGTGALINSQDGSTLVIDDFNVTGNVGQYNVIINNSVGNYTLYNALTVNQATNQASSLIPTYSTYGYPPSYQGANGLYQSNGKGVTRPQTNSLFIIDSSYSTFGAIMCYGGAPNPSQFNNYVSLIPQSNQTINISTLILNRDTSSVIPIIAVDNDIQGSTSIYSPNLTSGYIICFSGISIPAYSGFFSNMSNVIVNFLPNGISGINEIRVVAGIDPFDVASFLPITELEIY